MQLMKCSFRLRLYLENKQELCLLTAKYDRYTYLTQDVIMTLNEGPI